MWIMHVTKQNLTNEQRDYIADLVDATLHSVIEPCSFVVHDILESHHYCEIIIEGSSRALKNLCEVFRDNFDGAIACSMLH